MNNELRALGFAPLILPFAFCFYAYLADVSGFNLDEGPMVAFGLFVAISIVGLPVAYIYEFFIGYRFYQLLVKKNRVNFWSLTLGGVLVADIPMLFVLPVAGQESQVGYWLTVQLFSFVGLMIGLNFWFLLNLDRIRLKIKSILG